MTPMRIVTVIGAFLVIGTASGAQPKPFVDGDAAAGAKLVARDCGECHQRRFGDATAVYTRADRKVRSAEQLLAQVRRCNAELNAGYFPDEEDHVAAYLNSKYYGFKP
jgi:mono/diheme cytochrome c family protein